MRELAAKDIPNERKMIPKPEALELYRKSNQEFKCELVEEKAVEPMVSFYTTGKFIDFCRGPHIPSTGRIKAFKLMSVAGAYWKGDRKTIRRCSGSTARASSSRRNSTNICTSSKKPSGATIAGSAQELDLFQHSGRSRPGPDFLASQGRADPQADGRLAARGTAAPRLRSGLHAAHHAPRPLEDQRPRRISIAKICSARWKWKKPTTS